MSGDDAERPMTAYGATAERCGREWRVQVDGWEGAARVGALSEAKPLVRRMVWSLTGRCVDEVDLDVRLPGALADRLDVIAQYGSDLEAELTAAFNELADLGLSAPDIERVFEIGLRSDGHSSESVQPAGCHLAAVDLGER